MFRILSSANSYGTLTFATPQEALDVAIKRSGQNLDTQYFVVEEIVSVKSQKSVPPIDTTITPIKEGFRLPS